jgi:hypothetical protein
MCICQRNWQSDDCSERVCQFGLAFADTPKGDLDASGSLSGPNERVLLNDQRFPYGTTESFPAMEDTWKQVADNTAHAYMECSNAGVCDRGTGLCSCFDGFDGAGCQRLSCPGYPDNICSGHGVCANVLKTAAKDANTSYLLWDKKTIIGCLCDKGYSGGNCALQACPFGMDPTYMFDDSETVRYPVYNVALMTTAPTIDFYDGTLLGRAGRWVFQFFDLFGKGWLTAPLDADASCDDLVGALEALPNSLVSPNTVTCYRANITYQNPLDNTTDAFTEKFLSRWLYVLNGTYMPKNDSIIWRPTFWDAGFTSSYNYETAQDPNISGYIYRLEFLGNPGAAILPSISTYIGDGSQPSLSSKAGKLITKVWSDGRQGESVDYFPYHCNYVKVQVMHVGNYYYLTGFNSTEKMLLQACLGQADLDPTMQVAASDHTNIKWDYGSVYNPHIVKLVRLSTDHADGGYFVALYFDTSVTGLDKVGFSDGTFKLMQPFHSLDDSQLDWFELYTSKGVLETVSNFTDAFFDFASNEVFTANLGYDIYGEAFDGDVSCDPNPESPQKAEYVLNCLQKADKFFLLDPVNTQYNPSFLNLYTVERIYQKTYSVDVGTELGIWPYPNISYTPQHPQTKDHSPNLTSPLHYKTHTIVTDQATNWAQDAGGAASFKLFKFVTQPELTFTYVAQCSNRGICNTYDGICDCFPGYTGVSCSVQNALAV